VRLVSPWPCRPATAENLLHSVAAALDGSGPALAAVSAGSPPPPQGVPADVSAVVATSGSTGTPRQVLLDSAALVASATATHDHLGGPGRWLLALPLEHIAGVQVMVRSVLAGLAPVVADPRDVTSIAAAVADHDVRYAALVPTQLHRIVAGADRLTPEMAPLTDLDAILVGGAATSPSLLERALSLGLRVVTTYGATETSGGCVYDGVPLPGVTVELDPDPRFSGEGEHTDPTGAGEVTTGLIRIAGPTLARGYLDRDEPGDASEDDGTGAGFETRDAHRWFRTADSGRLSRGRLEVLGRADDLLLVGGHTLAPQAIEQVLATMPQIAEVCVVGVPDERWGQVPVAVVVPGHGTPDLEQARQTVIAALGAAAAPRRLVLVDQLPLRGPGKTDRGTALAMVMAH
jgi:o-succinylbenzoate---CoA ligase